jgi:hypothetical protein
MRELYKVAALQAFSRALREARALAASGGVMSGVKHLAQNKSPYHMFEKVDDAAKHISIPKPLQADASLDRGLTHALGNTAENIISLAKGTEGKGLLGGTAQVVKNMYSTGVKQIKGDMIKEVSRAGKDTIYSKDGAEFVKSRVSWLPDRKVVGTTDRNSVLIEKRTLMKPLAVAAGVSGPVAGGMALAFPDEGNEKLPKRIGHAAVDAAVYTASLPVGIGYSLAKTLKKKKQTNTLNNIGE